MQVTPEDLNTGIWRLKYYLERVKNTTTFSHTAVGRVGIRRPLEALPLETS